MTECPLVEEYKKVISQYETLIEHVINSLSKMSIFIDDFIKGHDLDGDKGE